MNKNTITWHNGHIGRDSEIKGPSRECGSEEG